MLLPFVFHIKNAKFVEILHHAISCHGPESRATENETSVITLVKVCQGHFYSSTCTYSCIFASYLFDQRKQKTNQNANVKWERKMHHFVQFSISNLEASSTAESSFVNDRASCCNKPSIETHRHGSIPTSSS